MNKKTKNKMSSTSSSTVINSAIILAALIATFFCRCTQGCAFHTIGGLTAESEGVRFIRLREDAEVGREILRLRAYPRSTITLKSTDGNGDHKYFAITEVNSTVVVVKLTRSLEDLVDRDVPRNLLKFRIICAGKNEKIEEGSNMSVTVYIEDINDNPPEFLNIPYIVDVDENTPPGTIVFENIQAFDRDKPNTPNSEVHFSMSTVPEQLSADGSPYFALKSPHRPLLVLKRELDFDNGLRLFKLPLYAWDRGTPANQVNTTITINVKDVDDMPPKFTEGVYRTKINEFYPMTGKSIRMPLYFSPPIMAFDQDSLNATLIYEIISGNERKLFRVNPHNGVLYLQKEIDLEEESLPGNTFVLQIEARQKDNPLKKALARIEVEVMDLNDNVPEFEADFYNISIVENLPTGFSVLQVNAIDRDQGENAEFLYNLIERDETTGAFRIDSRSGWITVRDDHLLDREKRKALHLGVEAIERNAPYTGESEFMISPSGPSMVKVEITLLDTNDNTPKFERGNLYEFKVSVTAQIGYVVGQVTANDPDEGPNGMLLYELQRPKGSGYVPFRIDSKNGTIYVAGPLRRGRIAVFVEASDQPTNPSERRFSLAVITIEVYATIDDQAIDFVGAPYEFWIGANAPLGTSVGQVRTTLIHDGEEEIMYDLLHTYSEGVPFAIEERSGIITVIRELSDFSRQLYHFEAVANYLFANSTQPLVVSSRANEEAMTTMAAPEMTDEGVLITNVTIHVVPKPENKIPLRPVIEEINMNIIHFHIEENISGGIIGQLLYKNGINVVNNELGSYRELHQSSVPATGSMSVPEVVGNVTVGSSRFRSRNQRRRIPRRLINDSNIKLRYIIANQQEIVNKITITEDGTLLTIIGLDREEKDQYDLTVIVEYSTGLMSGAGIYQVHIQVDDVNDNTPKFNALHFLGLINENSPVGTVVSLNQPIIITDSDLGKNAEFRVMLQGDYNELFNIELFNSSSNEDGNTFNIFNLTDQWNDEMRFVELQNSFSLPLSMLKMGSTTTGPYFRVIYNGKKPLDREKDQIYTLKVIAIDSGGLSGYAHLNILIADVNDNAPVFDRISVFKDARVEIREYTTELEIYFVENALATQQPSTAVLPPPPYHLPGSPRLSIEALPPLNDATILEKKPRSRPRSPRAMPKCPLFGIYEDSPMGMRLLQVTASDDDYGRHAQLQYEITDEHAERAPGAQLHGTARMHGLRHFAMDKISGELWVNHPLTAHMEVLLNLTAKDIDGLRDTTCLRFTIIDVNNHAPTFKKSWYSFDIAEDEYKDSVLGQVVAVDLDFGQNANITYSIEERNETHKQFPFRIKPSSGVIKIFGLLDREKRDKYSFQVIAADNAEPLHRLSSSVDVEVIVIDVNDNKPEFIGYDDLTQAEQYIADVSDRTMMLPLYKAYLDRGTKSGMFVKQLTAIDKDYVGNGNGLVLYSIQHKDQQMPIFQIDSRDGTITTVTSFHGYHDYEHLNVTVVASDLGSPVHSSTAIVLVNLQGQVVTEPSTTKETPTPASNFSLFQHQYYEVQITENNEAPTELIRLNISAGFNADLYRWSLLVEGEDTTPTATIDDFDTNAPFEFDSSTSILYALKSFDHEQITRYQLRLRADRPNREARNYARISYPVTDERVEGLELNELRIVVFILDENDNAPLFKGNGQPIIAVVPRSANFGYPVTRVEATDPDAGLNAEIRYRLLNEPSRLFGVDEYSGAIRLIALLPVDERVYGFDVKATDRAGADDGRSSIVNVFVYVIDESRQVRIVVAGKPVDVERRIDTLMKTLSDATQMDVRVRLLEPHMGGLEPSTDTYIYAVDPRSNAVVDMQQLQDTLASMQLDTLQLQNELDSPSPFLAADNRSMPRIIELAEFGRLANTIHGANTALLGGLEIITIVLIALCGIGACMTALCFLCLRQKRRVWSQQEFTSSETGLTYSLARAGIDTCRRRQYRNRQRQIQLQQQQQQHQQQHLYQNQSAVQTQTTAAVDKFEQMQYSQQQQLVQPNNEQRQYIDVPLPKSVSNRCIASAVENEPNNSPFVLKYNACQPVNNIPTNPYEGTMFSLHSSNGQDSGVDFLSSRELYESSPDSLNHSQHSQKCAHLCPRHAQEHAMELQHNTNNISNNNGLLVNGAMGDSSDNYDDSPRQSEPLVANNCRQSQSNSLNLCERHQLQQQLPHQHNHGHSHRGHRGHSGHVRGHSHIHNRSDYQNGNFDRRTSCVRHSFSGVKDDLMQNSPQISLRPRGHALRNSMNDLEERLHNLEQSFQRPIIYGKSNSVF